MSRLLICLTLFVHLSVIGSEFSGYQGRTERLKNIPQHAQADSVRRILADLTLESKSLESSVVQLMLEMGSALTDESFFLIMRHHSQIAAYGNQALIDKCVTYAKEHGLDRYISSLYVLKTTFFRREGKYDSAMIYTLRARDEADKYHNIEQQANVAHLLGDLYYSSGRYDKAAEYYQLVTEIKGNESVWKDWRERVIRNNQAQIEMKMGNYYKALGLFRESLAELGDALSTKVDSLAAAYIFLMTASNYLQLDNWRKAEIYADTALAFYTHLKHEKGLFDGFMLKAQLAVKEGDTQKAITYLDSVLVRTQKTPISPDEQSELLLLQSIIHEMKNEPLQALYKLKKFAALKDSISNNLYAARIQQIQSENDFVLLNKQYAGIKKQRSLYLTLFIITVAIALIIVLVHFRVRQKNRKLVALSIDVVKNRQTGGNIDITVPVVSGPNPHDFDTKQGELIRSFMELMSSKKLYLDSSISLQKVASALGTNRSYLSKAINLELNQGFSATVNALRINEAITIITQGNAEKIGVSGLAADTGFGSRTAFISAFSKHTGMLPSTFINNYKAIYKAKKAKDKD